MELYDALFVAMIVAIIAYICLRCIGITIWSSLVLSSIIGVSVMLFLLPISQLMESDLDTGVFVYILTCFIVVALALIYVIVKCSVDFER